MSLYPRPGTVHMIGVPSGVTEIEAEHTVRSECGGWVSVWTEINQNGSNGRPDMKIPRERIVMIEPRETAEKDSVSAVEREKRKVGVN